MFEYFDSHAHLTSPELFPQVEAILEHAKTAGLTGIVNVSTDAECIQRSLILKERYPWVHTAAAVHPHDVAKDGENFFPIVAQHARAKKLVAIGETGLDYHYMHSTPEIQQNFLKKHLQLAYECNLPVIIHCRDAFADLFRILDSEKKVMGVLHCFTGTLQEAQEALNRGWFISFSGIITFKKSADLRETAKVVPLEHLLIETDAPYLAPQSKRGKVNEPALVVETAEVLASVKGVSLQELAKVTYNNACRFFSVS